MTINRPVTIALFLCACASWAVSFSLVHDIVLSAGAKSTTPASASKTETAISASFALVEKALALRPNATTVKFLGGFESPFKTVSEARSVASPQNSTPPAPHRPKLVLKGILYKSNPLAILEDASGKTSILGVGDTLFGQKVAGIEKTSVRLLDRHGAYEISVKE
jgi:type II secretory pathway component PulC